MPPFTMAPEREGKYSSVVVTELYSTAYSDIAQKQSFLFLVHSIVLHSTVYPVERMERPHEVQKNFLPPTHAFFYLFILLRYCCITT